ncbi:UMTA methyltransferase family protein [Colletotrichum tofieldiae]|nr:UMTA methyltransferase family protein [Colletotrichum tofieldiae]GKT70625.1 UMTA methyltransferase family protein [Colletotrichum tofieldiae]GKT94502.1 UMTA methyltransferase family protein [Colletotrichum tofieldiae]
MAETLGTTAAATTAAAATATSAVAPDPNQQDEALEPDEGVASEARAVSLTVLGLTLSIDQFELHCIAFLERH